jgi:hypothetical protein
MSFDSDDIDTIPITFEVCGNHEKKETKSTCHLSFSSVIFKRTEPLERTEIRKSSCLSSAGALIFPTSPCFVSSNVVRSRKYCKNLFTYKKERLTYVYSKALVRRNSRVNMSTHILSIDGTLFFTISSAETCIRACSKFASINSAALTNDCQSCHN